MPITASEILRKRSVATGPGDTNAQNNPNASLGGFMSTTELTSGALNDLFDDISGNENEAQEDEFRCLFIHNAHGTLTAQNVRIWILSQVEGGADVEIGLDPTGIVAADSASAQAVTAADEDTAPAGVTFSVPADEAGSLTLPGDGNLDPDECIALWIRRVATNSAAINNDGVTLRVKLDTAA